MIEVNLIRLAEKYYHNKHYLFLILSSNDITLPANFNTGDFIKLPPRGPGARLSLASRLRNQSTCKPV